MAFEKGLEQSLPIRLIVVEDDFPLADGLRFLLDSLGCEVVGMAGRVETAPDLVTMTSFDLAVLDVDLHGERVTPVADAVRALGKSIVFLTGHGGQNILPQHLEGFVRLGKPIDASHLMSVICRVLERPTAS